MTSDTIVIIPTYNEIESVDKMVDAIFALPQIFDILFIDDNSPDGTAKKIKEIDFKYPIQTSKK